MSGPRRLSRARALATVAAAAAVGPRYVAAQTTPTLRIGTVAADSYAEPFYGQEVGIFERAGIPVDVTTFPSSGSIAAAAAGGAIDVGLTDISVIANAVQHGLPFVALAGAGLYVSTDPTTVLCTLRSSSYRTARDLEGQAVGVATLVSLSSIAVKAWLIQSGADLAKIRLVEMPSPQIPAALERGTIAAGLVAEPILCQIPADVRIFSSPFDAVSKRLALNNWFTTKDWIAANHDTAKRLLAAIYDTARWANSHHDDSIVIIAKRAKLDIDRVRTMRRATYATSLETRVTQPVLDSGYKYKAIDRQANAADLFAKL